MKDQPSSISPEEKLLTEAEREELENRNPHLWGTLSIILPPVLLIVGIFASAFLLNIAGALGGTGGLDVLLVLTVIAGFTLVTYFGVRVVRAEYAARAQYKILCAKLDRIEKRLAQQGQAPTEEAPKA